MTAHLSITGLSKRFGGVVAADDITLDFPPGSLSAVIGPNGAGKTTFFNLVTGKLRPDSGEIRLDGVNIAGHSQAEIVRRGVGRAFQVASIFPQFTVREALTAAVLTHRGQTGSLFRRFPRADAASRADEVMALVGLERAARTPSRFLSHGDQKLLDIALALALEPKVLLLDEPTAGMGPEERWQMIERVQRLWEEVGMTLVFIEHDMDIVFKIAQTIRVLRYGAVLAEGTAEQIRADPAVIEAYLGVSHEAPDPAAPGVSGSPRLSLQGIDVFYGASQILFGVDLAVERGATVALLGRNGAGKSTTFKAIAGLAPPRAGRIAVGGTDITGLAPYRIARRGVGYVPEDRQVFPEHSVEDNLRIAAKPGTDGSTHWTLERIFRAFPLLAGMRTRMGGRLSGGEQQMLTIARTLMGNPDVVLLDEPSEGLAPIIVAQIGRLIGELRSEGVTILLAEQNMHFCIAVASSVAIIDKGEIVYRGSVADLKRDEEISRRYLAV